jgi:MSHA biogenesis protein MshQ
MSTQDAIAPVHNTTHTTVGRPRNPLVMPLLFGAMLFAAPLVSHAVTDTFTVSGTWTAPAGVTSVDVQAWGGGGGGGGGDGTKSDGGGGGGGGAYSRTTTVTVVPGTTYTVTVGAAGTAGASKGTGGTGGDSWFINATTLMAKGGTGGGPPVGGAGGIAGTGGTAAASVGTTKFSGGNGGTGRNSTSGLGGPGGSSAGTAANGTSGPNPWSTCIAAAAPTGGGIGGDGGCANGQNGFAPASGNGGGGGGAGERNTSGGAGAAGLVTLTYTTGGGTGTVTSNPTLCVNDAGIGTQPWGGLTSVTTQDNVYASATANNSQITNFLKCTGYNFAIPAGAIINGITVGPWVNATRTFTVNAMQLVKTDVIQPTNLGAGTNIPNGGGALLPAPTQLTFGSATNLWGNTWTAADINAATFGAAFAAQRGAFNSVQTVAVDAMPITVSYTLPLTPVAEYRMDEASWNGTANEVKDNSGNALHGTAQLGASTAPGKLCNGGNFIAKYAEIPDNNLLDLTTSLTVTAWVKPNRWGGAPGFDTLMSFLSKDGNYEVHINDTGKVRWWWTTGAMNSATSVPIGSWTHVALVYANGSQTIYINGVADASGTLTGALTPNAMPFQIGDDQGYGGGTRRFDGMIDEVKIFGAALSPSQIATGYGNENTGKNWDGTARTCPVLLDHVSIIAPATAMAYSTVPVDLSLHRADHTAVNGYTINLATSTGLGDWSIGTGTGTLTPGAANSGLATYTFGAGESSASLYFTYQTTGSVSINVTDTGNQNLLSNTPVGELANTINYVQPDFAFTDSACVNNIAFGAAGQTCAVFGWSPRAAGIDVSNIYITALKAGVPTRLHPTQASTRNMAFALSCHNPVANAGVQATFAGVTLPLCTANGATPGAWSATTLAANFAGGNPSAGPYTFNYADVGKIDLWMHNSAVTAQVGASGPFVVAPHHFGISAVTAGPIKAGNTFAATVTAYNGLATPTATPNFGKETSPESVTLTFSKCQPTGTSSSSGSFSAGTIPAFSNGATTPTGLSWSEVGNGDLTATLSSGSYLLSGLTASGNTSTGGTVCNGAGNVGVFVPHHFNTYITAPQSSCPTGLVCPTAGWAYSGQPFTVNVSAANASDGVTVNYDGTANTSPNFAKTVTLTAWDAAGSTATQNPPTPPTGTNTLASTSIAASSFNQGSTITGTPSTPTYTFATTPTAPTDIYLRATDANATSLRAVAVTSIEGGLKIVSGRYRVANNYGSELLPLTMRVMTQLYSGSGWQTSTTDNTTTFNSALSTAGGNVVTANLAGLGGAVSIASPSSGAVASGIRTFIVKAPGAKGSVDLSLNAPAYLLTGSNGAAVNPSVAGHVTFGIYKGNEPIIYQREAY